MKSAIIMAVALLSFSSFSSETKQPKKVVYAYKSVIALSFPNSAHDTDSTDQQCADMDGVVTSRASMNKAYSVRASSAVCKIAITIDE